MAEAMVIELAAEQTYDLRHRVLRTGTPSTDVQWPGDDLATTVHLGVARRLTAGEEPTVLAISTWLSATSPDLGPGQTGVQLRGMATDPVARGHGFAVMLVRSGIERARRSGADHVWANARSDVVGFYVQTGFEITSDEFENIETAIPHRRVLLRC